MESIFQSFVTADTLMSNVILKSDALGGVLLTGGVTTGGVTTGGVTTGGVAVVPKRSWSDSTPVEPQPLNPKSVEVASISTIVLKHVFFILFPFFELKYTY
jgi:hypothetical protein